MDPVEIHNDNIKVRTPEGIWVDAKENQKVAFRTFKNTINPYQGEVDFVSDSITIKRIGDKHHGGIHTIEDGVALPIADWNDVKVFLLDVPEVEWYGARNYQTWAYYDFMYSGDVIRNYKSKGSVDIPNYIEMPIDGLYSNIIFSLSRNDNGTIFYEKNDERKTRVRISDNQLARRGYYGFYRRMTMDVGMMVPAPAAAVAMLSVPVDVVVEQTLNDEIMCITCNDNKQNIQFLPCKHTAICSVCYPKLDKSRQCPVCKQVINEIVKYDVKE
jgi:hypothetical protein